MRHLSLFTGSGIGNLAAKECGIETVAQCENDPACQYALRKIWPDVHLFEDIHDVSIESLRQFGKIDIISGGFPCQDISTAGRGEGIEGARSSLWREMFRIIRQVRPRWVLAENVPALRVRGIDRVIAPMERIGYTCWPFLIGSEALGGDIQRKRFWIVAGTAGVGPQKESLHKMLQGMGGLQCSRSAMRELADGFCVERRKDGLDLLRTFPVEVDGLPGGLLPKARNGLIRMVGNAWAYPNALMMFSAIAEMDRLTSL